MKPKSDRQPFVTKKFLLVGPEQVDRVKQALAHAPIDKLRPLEVVIREEVKARKPDQNALMWAGPMRDLAEQLWIEGRQYSAEVLHEFFKREFLPEEFDPDLAKEGYRKWDFTPTGDRVLVGSTTQLTVKGMVQYIEQLHAFGAQYDIKFHANPREVPT